MIYNIVRKRSKTNFLIPIFLCEKQFKKINRKDEEKVTSIIKKTPQTLHWISGVVSQMKRKRNAKKHQVLLGVFKL